MTRARRICAAIGAIALLALLLPAAAGATPFEVTNTSDTGTGSLREAIFDHNGSSAELDVITFAPDVNGTIALESPLGPLSAAGGALEIDGPGAEELAIDGQGQHRILTLESGADLSASGLTLRRGRATGEASATGGAISASGSTLTLSDTTLSGNQVSGRTLATGGAISAFDSTLDLTNSTLSGNEVSGSDAEGGAISASGSTLTLSDTTLSGNEASGDGALGGAIFAFNSTLTLTNSTLSGNQASGVSATGGAIFAVGDSTLTLTNSTLSGNSAADGANLWGSGPDLTITSTIIADPQGGGENCALFDTTTNSSHSLASDESCELDGPGDQQGVDPGLGELASNGGPTQTHALLPESPAIDRGANPEGLATDQRGPGFPRTSDDPAVPNGDGDGTDVGAFELQQPEPPPPAAPASLSLTARALGGKYNPRRDRRIRLEVGCGPVACEVKANGRIRLAGKRKPRRLDTKSASLEADQTKRIRLRTSNPLRRGIRRSLKRKPSKRPKFRLAVSATTPDGQSAERRLKVKVKRRGR